MTFSRHPWKKSTAVHSDAHLAVMADQFLRDAIIPGHLWAAGLPRLLGAAARKDQERDEHHYGGHGGRRLCHSLVRILVFAAMVLGLVLFFFYPLVKTLGCGGGGTTLGLTGYAWFVLILLFPFLGVFFFIFGDCAAMPALGCANGFPADPFRWE
jgi:hypothetical protein